MTGPATRALSLFDDYVDLPAVERTRALAALAASDPELHAALSALLDADARHDDDQMLDRSPAQVLAGKRGDSDDAAAAQDDRADLRLGTRLGPWRIDRVIGRGGMGTVYEAHRDDGEYQQRVALKCIRTELATPQLQAAFRDERNLLARLDHSGIAALIDGGVGEDGQPWFAMRFVDGIALDLWCDRRRASVRERVGLLIQVCEALGHAHAQGIVHRDIKPSNLLVTEDGRVQLVDFGISSHFAARDAVPREQIAITADYAAPEARESGAHGPATDLYALGVLTYRLLCAHWPAPLHSLRNLIPIAASGEPIPMDRLLDDRPGGADTADDNAEVIARQRGAADAAALRKQLAGDLSAIALKAVAPRPQDRYASVSEFADELRRWCEHRPVRVNPGSGWSRARKWQRRNPGAVAIGAGLLLVLCIGLSMSLWQQRRAQREAAATGAVSQLFASTLGTATLSGLGTTPFSSRALLEKTERELRGLPLQDQPRLLARGLATLARSYAVIGDYRYAGELSQQAQDLLDRSGESDAFVVSARIAMLNIQYRFAQARDLATQQIQALGDRDDEQTRLTRIAYGAELAKAQWGLGENQQAARSADRLVEQTRSLGPGNDEIIAQALMLRSGFYSRLLRPNQAETDLRRAMALARPSNAVLADDALEQLASILRRRTSPEYPSLTRELLRNRRNTLGPSHPKTAFAMVRVGLARYPDTSGNELRQALEILEARTGRDHPDYALALSASVWAITSDPRERIALQRQALATLYKTVGPRSDWTISARYNLGLQLIELYDASLASRSEGEEGIALVLQAARERSHSGTPAFGERAAAIMGLLRFGEAWRLPLAQALVDESKRDTKRYLKPGDLELEIVYHLADRVLYRQGQYARADRGFADRIEANRDFMRIANADSHKSQSQLTELLSESLVYRALYAFGQCRQDRAQAFLLQAVEFDRRALGAEHPTTRSATSYLDHLRRQSKMADDSGARLEPPQDLDRLNQQAQAC